MSTMNKWNRFLVSSSCKLSSSSPSSSSSFRFFSSFHCPVGSLSSSTTTTTTTTHTTDGGARRSHYSYSSPGHFHGGGWSTEDHKDHRHNWKQRGFTVGIGGPVGSGKTALVLALTKRLAEKVPLGVVTNDIFTQEDAEFLTRSEALPAALIRAVETGGCPHAAIREDVSANLTACEDLTQVLQHQKTSFQPKVEGDEEEVAALILCESGGDNLAANFSRELADLTLYVIDVAGGDKVPRKGGPGITQSDLLIVNKIDLAEAVGADLGVMRRDADRMRCSPTDPNIVGPTVFASVRNGTSVEDIENFILERYSLATKEVDDEKSSSSA